MDWFYAINGQQSGPVSEAELEKLLRSGTINQDTLVWRDGMANWLPLQTARTSTPPPPPNSGVCIECGKSFPQDDMLLLNHSWVCAACKPVFLQRLREGSALVGAGGGVWRMNRKLVMRPETPLPDRCVSCNAPANGFRLKRQLYWHPPAYYILIVISILIYAIVAIIVRKKALIHIGLCEKHRAQRKWAILGSWIGIVAGLALFITGLTQEIGTMIITGLILLVVGIVVGVSKGPVVSAAKIDKEFVWVKGAKPAFLEAFPEWTGPK